MITAMKQTKDVVKHHKTIVNKLDSILISLDILMEDPLFIDNIHGEQELSLDQTVELFKAIKEQFIPLNVTPELDPLHEADEIDIS
jgi:hypothetical protein|tara:strand:+ start:236 stop:493 length:258 start_codon:yes stop_codon:yes gene_type:complete